MNSNTKIRKTIEKTCFYVLSPLNIFIDFNEEGGEGKDEFVRVDTPFVITEVADIGSVLYRNDGTVTIQVFAQTKTRAIEIYDMLLSNFKVGKKIEMYDIRLNVLRMYTEFSSKDSAGSYYQINAGIDFYVYTL